MVLFYTWLNKVSGRELKQGEGALSKRTLSYIVKKYASCAKLYDASSYDLHHQFGYRMAESVPLHRLAQYWASISPPNTGQKRSRLLYFARRSYL